jgi:DNA-binding beta-propeller fold protein YncE
MPERLKSLIAALRCCTSKVSRNHPGRLGLLHIFLLASPLLDVPVLDASSGETESLADPDLVVSEADQAVGLQAPTGIAFDVAHGEVLVVNSGQRRVDIFDMEGFPLGHFEHRIRDAAGNLITGSPRALTIDAQGRVFLVDQLAPYVDVLDYKGQPLEQIPLPAPDDRLDSGNGAGEVALRANGHLLVGTRGKQGRVHEFDSEFQLLRSWGAPGSSPGSLSRISGLCEAPDGGVVVVCVGTELVVQIFRADGGFVKGFGVHDIGPGNFSLPSGVATTPDGRIWVSDELRQIVQVFNAAGNFLGVVGGGGRAPGEFLYPSALASDGHGLIAVTERVGNRYQLLRLR